MKDKFITEEFTVTISRNRTTNRLLSEIWEDVAGRWHRTDGQPAVRYFHPETGIEHTTMWCRNGKLHREGGKPALISHNSQTGLLESEFWYLNNILKREDADKPVIKCYNTDTGSIKTVAYRVGRKIVYK